MAALARAPNDANYNAAIKSGRAKERHGRLHTRRNGDTLYIFIRLFSFFLSVRTRYVNPMLIAAINTRTR